MTSFLRSISLLVFTCIGALAGLAGDLPIRLDFESPRVVACAHEAMVMDGLGVLFPNAGQAVVPGGIVSFGGADDTWPQDFLLGLVPCEDSGVMTYPFTVALDDDTGEALFRNANGVCFYSVSPAYADAAAWFRLRLGLPALGTVPAYRELSHIVSEWVLVQKDDVDTFVEGRNVQGRRVAKLQSRRVAGSQSREMEGVAFTEFEITDSEPPEYVFSFAWSGDAVATNDVLDLYGAPVLTTNEWHQLASVVASNGTECVITLSETNFPWYLAPVECPREGCACPACIPVVVTNYAGSAFDPSATNLTRTVVTNTTCDCPSGAPTGFFRLFRRADSDADGLLDAKEVLLYGTDPLSADSDGDFLPDDWEIANGLDPLNRTGNDGFEGNPDGDSLDNWMEFQYATHPLLVDTNVDGIPDGSSAANWERNFRWAEIAHWTNLIVSIDVRMPETPGPHSAALRVGLLVVPLNAGPQTLCFSIPKGNLYEFSAICTGGAQVSFSVSEGYGTGLWTDNDGCGAGHWVETCFGVIIEPTLRLVDLNGDPVEGRCIHGPTNGVELVASVLPYSCGIDPSQIACSGLERLSNGHFWLPIGPNPGDEAEGRVSVMAPGLAAGIIESTAFAHRCRGSTGDWCEHCGIFHDSSQACWHAEFCPAHTGGTCTCEPPALRILRHDEFDHELRTNLLGESTCCCPDVSPPVIQLISVPENLVVLANGGRLHAGDYLEHDITIRAKGVSGSGPSVIGYDVVRQERVNGSIRERREYHEFPVWAIDPVLEPITTENEYGILVNPCGIVRGGRAVFRAHVSPVFFPASSLVWSVEPAGCVSFPEGNTGERVIVQGVSTNDVVLKLTISGYHGPMPQILARVVESRTVDVRTYILGDGEHWATDTNRIAEILSGVNNIYRQVGISFNWVTNSFITDSQLLTIDYGHGRWFEAESLFFYAEDTGGLELYFVDCIAPDSNGYLPIALCSSLGIAVSDTADARAVAHEIGHACGLKDIYVYRRWKVNGTGPFVEAYSPEEIDSSRIPKDWNSPEQEGYYSDSTNYHGLISRSLMMGVNRGDCCDMEFGNMEGLTSRYGFDRTENRVYVNYVVTNVSTGYFEEGISSPISQ